MLNGLHKMKIKWIGVDCVAADHPMNTIQRIWHPKTFEEANAKLKKDFGKDWDEMYPLDQILSGYALQSVPQEALSMQKTWVVNWLTHPVVVITLAVLSRKPWKLNRCGVGS